MTVQEEAKSATSAELTTFANDVHGYLRQNITWADQKAALLFAGVSTFLVYLHTHNALGIWKGDQPYAAREVVGLVAAICLTCAALGALGAYWPRTKGVSTGVVFWGAIARLPSAGDYIDAVTILSARDLAEQKLRHGYELSRICRLKFAWIDVATRFAVIGFMLAITHVVIWR